MKIMVRILRNKIDIKYNLLLYQMANNDNPTQYTDAFIIKAT